MPRRCSARPVLDLALQQCPCRRTNRCVITSRAAETETRLGARDETKHERGADRIVDIADHVIDNTSSLAALKLAVHRLVSIVDVRRISLDVSDPDTQVEWLRQARDHVIDDQSRATVARRIAKCWRPGRCRWPSWTRHPTAN